MYFIQHCFICRPSDSAVPEDADNSALFSGWKHDSLTMVAKLKTNRISITMAQDHYLTYAAS
jgi:hypothetical protein